GEEHSWFTEGPGGELLFAEGAFDLNSDASMSGNLRILPGASVSVGALNAAPSWIKDEEGFLAITDPEVESRLGRLDLIGSSLEIPAGADDRASFLGIAEGSLTVASKARW